MGLMIDKIQVTTIDGVDYVKLSDYIEVNQQRIELLESSHMNEIEAYAAIKLITNWRHGSDPKPVQDAVRFYLDRIKIRSYYDSTVKDKVVKP
jgi:hypothetical protein